jgi:hypothetical protein
MHRPRGPWLGNGLFCPVASSLTMASSALLDPPSGLLYFVRRVFASKARTEKVPDLSCVSFDPCRLPYPGGPDGFTVIAPSVLPSPFWERLGVHGIPLESVRVGGLTRLQSSLYAAARIFGCPSPTRTFTRAFDPSSRLNRPSNIPTRPTVNYRGRTCTGRHSAVQAATQNFPNK